MKKHGSGYTLIEMLIVVTILAVLAGVGYNYYFDLIDEARVNTVKGNMRTVKDAIARFFKDRLVYPTSLDELRGPYLQQSVAELILNPLLPQDGTAQIEIQVPAGADINVFQVPEAGLTWTSDLASGKQFKNIRVKFGGNYLY
jgi:prepilin-type N-terminal cleavage/methylation domain-containing protein